MFAVRQYCHGNLITENRRPSVGFGRNCIGVNSNMMNQPLRPGMPIQQLISSFVFSNLFQFCYTGISSGVKPSKLHRMGILNQLVYRIPYVAKCR